jgi:hypothetical protein
VGIRDRVTEGRREGKNEIKIKEKERRKIHWFSVERNVGM